MSLLINHLPSLYVIVITGSLTTSTTLALRLAARRKQRMLFGMDDYLAILSWFVYLGVVAASIYGIVNKIAIIPSLSKVALIAQALLFYKNRSPEIKQQQALFGGALCNIVALGCGRLSAVFFYRRIFYTVKRDVFDIITKIIIGILLAWTICFFLSTLLSCGTNIEFITIDFDFPGDSSGNYCVTQDNQNGLAISSLLLDLIVLILPLPKIWALQAPRARKIAISSIFLIALISLTASCLRVMIVYETDTIYEEELHFQPAISSIISYFYQLLETAACLTAINMPSIWYFFRHFKAEKLRRIVGVVLSFSSAKLRRRTEKSDIEMLKNESTELSDSEAMPTRRAHLELEGGHTLGQDQNSRRNNHQV